MNYCLNHFPTKVFIRLFTPVISFFFPLQAVRQVAVLLPVIPPAATAPLGRSRITVRINHLRSLILSLRGLQIVQGPLDREWETKNNLSEGESYCENK